ncbi:MAG: hypothetical protein WAO52_11020 [Prolixibacteraceae bacterium]
MAIIRLLIYPYFASMIKLGIFGDQTTNPELLVQLNTIPDTRVSGVYISGNVNLPEGISGLSSPEGLMDISDVLLLLSDKSVSSDLIKMILRKSKHVYLKTIPNMNVREIKELIDLEKEAGIVTFISNPFNDIPWLDPFQTQYEKPFMINLRTCFEGNVIRPAHEMLLLITALNRLAQSNYKKLDVFGLKHQSNQILIQVRIEYENGSVFNVTISQEKSPGYCEIFEQQERKTLEFQLPLYDLFPKFNQEYSAITYFMRMINDQDKKTDTFDNFLNGLQILQEIKEHLRFNEIVF